MNTQQRIALMVSGPVILVFIVGYFVVSGAGGGGLGGGNDVEGEWLLTLPVDTSDDASNSYEDDDPDTVGILVEFDQDESGELVGQASSEYAGDEYPNLDVLDITEVDGKVSFSLEGYDNDPDSAQDKMNIQIYDETESPGELEGTADGQIGVYDPNVAGTFTGERQ